MHIQNRCRGNRVLLLFGFLLVVGLGFVCRDSALAYTENELHEIAADFNELNSLNEDELSRVVSVTAYREIVDDVNYALLERCPDLSSIYYSAISYPELSYLSDVDLPDNNISVYFIDSRINLPQINQPSVKSISFAGSEVFGLKNIESMSQIEYFGFGETIGYEQLDYSKFINLKGLALNAFIEDFDALTASIPNVTDLSLAASNIQNKDTVYLERLTNLKSLHLGQTYLTDIDFLESLSGIEELTLPWSIQDLTRVYDLPNLRYLNWEAYTELFVTQDFVDYLDSKNVEHPDYNPSISAKIDDIIQSLKLPDDFDEEEALSAIVEFVVNNTRTDSIYDGIVGSPTGLDLILLHQRGVCYHHSIAVYTLAKVLGLYDVYAVTGLLDEGMHYYTGRPSEDPTVAMVPHEWNLLLRDGRWYGVDAAQMNANIGMVVNRDMNFWKNPTEDDDYDFNYALENYLDYNYFFARRHYETDGVLRQVPTYEFENIDNLQIVNHVIYEVDQSDYRATSICARVLTNYYCQYIDIDEDGKTSSGDKIEIYHDTDVVDVFLLDNDIWKPPLIPRLGKLALKYKNYPEVDIDSSLSTNYFDKDNPLLLTITGQNYDDDRSYPISISIIDMQSSNEIYNRTLRMFGLDINNGIQIELQLFDAMVPKEHNSSASFGVMQYVFRVSVGDDVRDWGCNYFIGDDNNIVDDEEFNYPFVPNTGSKRVMSGKDFSLINVVLLAPLLIDFVLICIIYNRK